MNEWLLFSWLISLAFVFMGPPNWQKSFFITNLICGVAALGFFHIKLLCRVKIDVFDCFDCVCGIISIILFLYLIF